MYSIAIPVPGIALPCIHPIMQSFTFVLGNAYRINAETQFHRKVQGDAGCVIPKAVVG
jgi:hypothetical protein